MKTVQISNSLAISSSQYIEYGQLEVIQNFKQYANGPDMLIMYDIIYFNMRNQNGRKCYFNYFNSQTLPCNVTACTSDVIDDNQQTEINCLVFANCTSESFTYTLNLKQIQNKQNVILIQNNNVNNFNNKLPLNLTTLTSISIQSSNIWFYLSVALTCFLLLSLVLLTGVVLYWSLNYRKAKRQLEEIKLTEVDTESVSMRKSLRKSLMKN